MDENVNLRTKYSVREHYTSSYTITVQKQQESLHNSRTN